MATLNITVPEAMKAFVHEQALKHGFGTVSEYMRAMIRGLQEQEDCRSEIRQKLLEAVRSGPATPWTEADWDGIRRELQERHGKRQGRTNGREGTNRR
jgi:antitoxin ParD1/3/4